MKGFIVNPDGSEQLQYTMTDMPVRAYESTLSTVNGYAASCHWHNDFEMLTVPEGEIDYFVNGHTVHLKQGEGIFVNARRLHYGFSAKQQDCVYRFVVFHPDVMGNLSPVKALLETFSADTGTDYWTFGASSEAVLLFKELYAAADSGNLLMAAAKCAELVETVRQTAQEEQGGDMRSEWIILRRMTGYIQTYYQEKIKLEQIAAAGAVCRNRCCLLFKQNLNCSPMEFVTRYRLDKACEMLRQGYSVTEAALSNGFNGASYFAEIFRRIYQKTPKEYQKEE